MAAPLTAADHLSAVAASRDRQAFAALFHDFAPRVKSYLLRTTRDPVRADELVQEVMLRVWRKAHQYDARKASVSTWIFTIARNVRIDAVRRERRPTWDPQDPVLVPSQAPGADQVVSESRRAARLREALADLPAEQAVVLQGAYFDDKTLSTLSHEMSVPLGTVKSRVRLAMKRLRQALGTEGDA